MTQTIIILFFSLILLLATAGCTGILPVQTEVQDPAPGEPTPLPPDTVPDTLDQPQPVATGYTAITQMEIRVQTLDFSGFHDMDGLIIKYRFYDSMNRFVSFDRAPVSMEVTVYSPDTNRQNQRITPRMLYRGTATIHRSLPENNDLLRGIWIPYHELQMTDSDRGIGRIHVKATLPHGVVLEAEERYIFPVRR
ncbi:MAG: hypothetical protein D5R96_06100 [Methanocalculus sp. MSAO_Arc2]|uniref:hypothetical protein n=1 Tax=Methanocalculus sp. MSAO_Arc2 TaxID=2293855 RepID=UPI000FF39476|nr:MAG: hypothetical protein D5R96_06100 [Methanocalculus sp. MSAO_Arc2]